MAACHSDGLAGHFRKKNTMKRLGLSYFWMGMGSTVAAWIRACPCQHHNMDYVRPVHPFRQTALELPWESIQVDVYGPLIKSWTGNRFIINIICLTSGEQKLQATKVHTAEVIADTICRRVILEENMTPKRMSSDNASELKGRIAVALAEAVATKWQTGVPYHPQSQAPIERSHRPLAIQVAMCIRDANQRDWDENLPSIESSIRTSCKEGSQFSRLFLKTGRDNCTPIDRVLNVDTQQLRSKELGKALDNLAMARVLTLANFADAQKARQRRLANGPAVPNPFSRGDLVMLYRPTVPAGLSAKLYHKMTGPYKIKKWLDDAKRSCIVEDPLDAQVSIRVHVDHLVKYFDLPADLQIPTVPFKLPLAVWPGDAPAGPAPAPVALAPPVQAPPPAPLAPALDPSIAEDNDALDPRPVRR